MTEPIAYASPEDAAKMDKKKKNRKRKRGSKPSESNTTGTEESEPQIPNQIDKEDKGDGDWEEDKDDIDKRHRLRPQVTLDYCIVASSQRIALLYSFMGKNQYTKGIVFFCSCDSVKFHSDLLRSLNANCFGVHEKQTQQERTTTFFDFCKAEKGFLLCTNVAACGLDIPAVDWILQFDPPDDLMEYLRRVVRRARGECEVGKEFLFLTPEEMRIIRFLEAANIFLRSRVFKVNRKVQAQLEQTVGDNYYLRKSAKEAHKSYLIAYNSHSMKDYFNFDRLDLQGVAASFCVSIPPRQR
ncbi:hypothetical protein C1H46_016490 [Malus baccata]|uniref:ATP-dependent RNA helicase n=1 Tax=Malus baccata TaxID=106549 RepID=A0A540MGT0_MALBA|nr:hypothetical protein C1H46_016490 [Malus baccata]